MPTRSNDTAVIVEHRLGGRWLTHERFALSCIERALSKTHEPLYHNEVCWGTVALHAPGEYRLRLLFSPESRRGPWQSATSRRFRVSLPPEVSTTRLAA